MAEGTIEPEWLVRYDVDVLRACGISDRAQTPIKREFAKWFGFHSVDAIYKELISRGLTHDEIASKAVSDRTSVYRWVNGDSAPLHSAIELLIARTGLKVSELKTPSISYQLEFAFLKTINFVKNDYIKGSKIPESLDDRWVACLEQVLKQIEGRAANAKNDEIIAKRIIIDVKRKVAKLSKFSVEDINLCLNNWFMSYHVAVIVVGDLRSELP